MHRAVSCLGRLSVCVLFCIEILSKGTTQAHTQPVSIGQWVSRVTKFSTQYDSRSWSATAVQGKPDVYPRYGDRQGAWAQRNTDANQFIEVEFLQKLFIEKINIYETYHAGGVMKIQAKQPNGSWYTVWQTQSVSDIHSSRIFSPHFDKLSFECNALRIEVDCTKSRSYVEIDAIKITGTTDSYQQVVLKPKPVTKSSNVEQWVSKVGSYSSQWNGHGWSATAVQGKPNVYPRYGDRQGAWAQRNRDDNQFIEVEFLQKLFIEKIYIYETYHAGGVKRIQAKHPNGSWYAVWQTQHVSDIHSSRIFSPHFDKLSFECNALRIEVDCTKSRSYVEIDAIKITGTTDSYQQVVLKPTPVTKSSNVEQWVSKVRSYSSQWNGHGWSATAVQGKPDVYPRYGDRQGAWAPRNTDANQFIEVEYAVKIFIERIDIYETFHAGGVMGIQAKHPNGSWHTVWQTQKVSNIHSSRIFSPHFDKLTFKCNVLRIKVDCTKSRSYVEIDAIKIIGTTVPSDSHQHRILKRTPVTNVNNVEQWVSKVRNYSSQWDGHR